MCMTMSSSCLWQPICISEGATANKCMPALQTVCWTMLLLPCVQVLLLQRLCKHMAWSNLEVLTVDKCQGRDKDVVLLSLVRSNDENNAGNLLRDWRRLNVAITRAKKKLILIGSQKTLRTIAHFSQLLKLMSQRQWSLSLPCLD